MDSNKRHKPERMCVACRGRFSKDDLLRVVKLNQTVSIDSSHKILARGVYLCKNIDCLKLAQKKKCIERGFKGVDIGSIYADIQTILMSEGSKIDGK